MAEWQPIETVPKDGTPVILFGTTEVSPFSRPHIGCEDVHVGQWAGGGFEHLWLDSWIVDPTHWMPLPKPPEK